MMTAATQAEKTSAWEKRWGWFKEQATSAPGGKEAFQRFQAIRSSPFVTRSKEKLEDMRERWETSDSRVVQGIQNMHESWSRESETALAMKEIR